MDESGLTVRIPQWNDDDLALICGIANAGGGTLLVQTDDRTASFGFRKMRRIFESIPALVQRSLGIPCYTEPIMESSQMWLHITIPAAEYPLSYDGTFYLYADGENTKIDGAVLEKMMQEDEGAKWEKRTSLKANTSKVLFETASLFRDAIADDDLEDDGSLSFLSAIGLKDARSNLLTNAGVLLLSEHPEAMIPGAYIRIAKMDAKTNRPESSDEITGPLLTQVDSALDRLITYYLEPMGSNADDQSPITAPPHEALREALLNAVVHKDYESAIPIQVSVYPTQVTIFNTGRPPASWTADELMQPHPSRPNHPLLAEALRKVGKFHGWGSGFASMIALCSDAGMSAPSWRLGEDDISIVFPLVPNDAAPEVSEAAASEGEDARASETTSQDATDPTEAQASESQGKSKLGRHARTPLNSDAKRNTFAERSIAALLELELTGTDEYILKVLQTNGRVTATRIASVLEVSESTVRRSFRRLKEHDLIERVGSDKAGYWKVNL